MSCRGISSLRSEIPDLGRYAGKKYNMYSNKEFPKEHVELHIDRVFSKSEYENITKGVQAQSMDDKWNIEFIKPFLYVRRSWTGNCLYKIEFKEIENQYKVIHLYSNRNPEEYKETDCHRDSLLALSKLDQLAGREYKTLFDSYIQLVTKNNA